MTGRGVTNSSEGAVGRRCLQPLGPSQGGDGENRSGAHSDTHRNSPTVSWTGEKNRAAASLGSVSRKAALPVAPRPPAMRWVTARAVGLAVSKRSRLERNRGHLVQASPFLFVCVLSRHETWCV